MTGTRLSLKFIFPLQWCFLLLGVLLCLTGCSPESKYRGDGKLWMVNDGQGFHIRFEDFDLSKPFHARYKMAGCPHSQWGAEVLLQVTPALQENRELLLLYTEGILTMEATDSDGSLLFKCGGPLKTCFPSGLYTDGRLVADEYYYGSESAKSTIPADAFNSQSPVLLKVDYQPAPTVDCLPMRLTGSIHAISG